MLACLPGEERTLVTGHYGFVGVNLIRSLSNRGINTGSTISDLTIQKNVEDAFSTIKPTHVFHCAGYVRGIAGNMANQAESYRINTLINTNVVSACIKHKVKKIVAIGTVAMYGEPRGFSSAASIASPRNEETILDHEPRHEYAYAMAKRGMLAHLEVSGLEWAMPIATNMYGPHDRFDKDHGHVISSLVRKFHERDVTVWGDGSQTRDFLHVKDAVRALMMIMEKGSGPINMATGASRTIGDVVEILAGHTAYDVITWDKTKPIGQRSRSYDVSKLRALGFSPEITLEQGLVETYDWYAANEAVARK